MTLRVAVAVGALAVGVGGVWLIQSMRQRNDATNGARPTAEATVRRTEPTFQPNVGVGEPTPTPSIVAAPPSAEPSASVAPSASSAPSVAGPVSSPAGPGRPPQNPTVKPPLTATPSSTDKGNLGQWN